MRIQPLKKLIYSRVEESIAIAAIDKGVPTMVEINAEFMKHSYVCWEHTCFEMTNFNGFSCFEIIFDAEQ